MSETTTGATPAAGAATGAATDGAPARHAKSVTAVTISQGFSAASNFVILVALGRVGLAHSGTGAREVGQYALAFAVYSAALGLQRATLTDPLTARAPGATAPVDDEDHLAITVSLAIACGAAVVALLVGLATGYHQLVVLAPFLVALLLEDACRYLFFRRGQHGIAVVLDGIWLALSCSALFVLKHYPLHSAHTVAIVIWGAGGAVAAVVGLIVLRARLVSAPRSLRWWRTHISHSSRWLSIEAAFFHADQQTAAFGFTALAGAKLFGEYQIAGSLIGVSVFLTTGVSVVATTYLTRHAGVGKKEAAWVAAACFACVAAWTLVLAAMSGFVVHLLYNSRVEIPTGMLLATGAITAMVAAAGGPQALLLARQTERVLPVARGVAYFLLAPLAVVVSGHNFAAALWILALESFVYFVLISVRAFMGGDRAPVATEHA